MRSHRIASAGFFGQNRKLKQSCKNQPVRAKSEFQPRWKNPDLGAGLAEGFYAGFHAGQGPAEPLQFPGSLLYVLYVLYGCYKASY